MGHTPDVGAIHNIGVTGATVSSAKQPAVGEESHGNRRARSHSARTGMCISWRPLASRPRCISSGTEIYCERILFPVSLGNRPSVDHVTTSRAMRIKFSLVCRLRHGFKRYLFLSPHEEKFNDVLVS